MIKEVKTFVEKKLSDAEHSYDPAYIRDMFFAAYGAICFVVENKYSEELVTWWDAEMWDKFHKLIN